MKDIAIAGLAGVTGAAAIVLGGLDDAPGLQLLGAACVIAAIVLGVRAVRRSGARGKRSQ